MPDGGVYALSLESGLGVCFSIPVQPLCRNGKPGLMHIASAGRWEGHPDGPFEFSAELFDKLVDRFAARGGTALLVDYDHKSKGKRATSEDENKASGWIRALWREGEGADAKLMSVVDFTPKASQMIDEGEYLYCSPVVAWSVADKRTNEVGPELLKAALTNEPFQDNIGHTILLLSDSRKVELAAPPPPPKKDGEKDAPPPAEGDAPVEGESAAEGAEGEEPQEDAPPQADAGNNPPPENAEGPADPLMSLATQLGVDRQTVCAVVEANMDVFATAIGNALEKQRTEQTMATPETKAPAAPTQLARDVEEIKTQLAADRKQAADDRAAAKKALVLSRVDALIADGYGTEQMRDYFVHELSVDLDKGAEKIKAAGKAVPVGETQAGDRDQVTHKGKVTELNDDERRLHDTWVKARLYKSQEAVNRLLARRERAAGKAA